MSDASILFTLAAEAAAVFAVSFFMFLGSYKVMFLAINDLLNDNEQRDEEVACHSAHIDGPDLHVAAHSSTGPLSTQNKVGLIITLQKEGRRIRARETAHACDTVLRLTPQGQ